MKQHSVWLLLIVENPLSSLESPPGILPYSFISGRLIKENDYRMLCPALPAGKCKNVSMFQKYSFFLSRRGHYIGRKTPHLFTPCPVRDKMFSSSHYVPDGTLAAGEILLSTDMLSPAGRKTTFFTSHLRG